MADTDQDKLFSPVEWNKRFSATDVLTNFVKLGTAATLRVRQITSCEIDVPYGSSDGMKYDIYGTDLPNDAPILVFIHGGYWRSMSKDIAAAFPVEQCVASGIKVICVGYDLHPNVELRDIISEIKIATHKILEDAAVSGSRGVWIGGHCAGAHLAASILDPVWLRDETNIELLKGFVLFGGLYFLEPLLGTSYNKLLKLDSNEAKLMSTLSKELELPALNLKVMLVIGECDSPAFIKQTRQLTEKLCSIVDNVEYILLRDGIDHFNMVENLTQGDFSLTKRIINVINNS